LAEYGLLQVIGGNRNTTGYSYKLVENRSYEALQKSIDAQIEKVVKEVWEAHKQRNPKEKQKELVGQ
jgi:hypothetical protein